jgi:hypothetical protein
MQCIKDDAVPHVHGHISNEHNAYSWERRRLGGMGWRSQAIGRFIINPGNSKTPTSAILEMRECRRFENL